MSYMPLSLIISAVTASTQATQSDMVNSTGSTIDALTPVRVDSNGSMSLIDVALDASALSIVGITKASVLDTETGVIVTQGKIEDITTAFAVGDYVYVSKTGSLTNVLPEAGTNDFVAGDYIIRIGVVAKNTADANKKDLFVGISIVGQL
jgi:hypothetical protein